MTATTAATPKKKKAKHPCSPAIWKKFSRTERQLWLDLYHMYLLPENFHVDWADHKKFKAQRHVVAHNLACETIWYFQQYLDTEMFTAIWRKPKKA